MVTAGMGDDLVDEFTADPEHTHILGGGHKLSRS